MSMERLMAKRATLGMACSSEDLTAKRSLQLDRELRERVLQRVEPWHCMLMWVLKVA